MNNLIQVIVHCNEYEDSKRIESLGRVKYRLPMINACVVEVDRRFVKDIEELKGVEKVELDTHITAQMKNAGAQIKLQYAHNRKIYGNGVGVAVLDTGIYEHRDFFDNNNSRIWAFVDFVNGRKRIYDDNGHGTHVWCW